MSTCPHCDKEVGRVVEGGEGRIWFASQEREEGMSSNFTHHRNAFKCPYCDGWVQVLFKPELLKYKLEGGRA